MLKALIFDVDGTLANTETLHLEAFNYAFKECGLNWVWGKEKYIELLNISGGKERITTYFKSVDNNINFNDNVKKTINKIHKIKTKYYTNAVKNGELKLRKGIFELINDAQKNNIKLAIATTTTPSNIDALLGYHFGGKWEKMFDVIEHGLSATTKKPDPLVYRKVIMRLRLPPIECIALEDSYNGLQAASNAGIRCIVTPTVYTKDHNFSKAFKVLKNLDKINIAKIIQFNNSFSTSY